MPGIFDAILSDFFIWYSSEPLEKPIYHCHNAYEIYLFLGGQVHFAVEKDMYDLTPGSILLVRPWENHRVQSFGSYFERYALNISQNIINVLSTEKTDFAVNLFERPFGHINIIQADTETVQKLAELMNKLYTTYHENSFGNDVLCLSYICQILVSITEYILNNNFIIPKTIMPALVSKTIDYIDTHLTEKISSEMLSDSLFYSSEYINRCFKQTTGLTVKEYILRRRLSIVQEELLKGTSVTLSAEKAGFGNLSNFTRTFEKYIGMSPKQFQKDGKQYHFEHPWNHISFRT